MGVWEDVGCEKGLEAFVDEMWWVVVGGENDGYVRLVGWENI